MEQIKPDTPLVYLTVEQFTSLLQKYLSPQVSIKKSLSEYFGVDAFCEITGYKKNTVYQFSPSKENPCLSCCPWGKEADV